MTSLVTIRLRRREASELRDVLSIRTTAGLARVQAALDAALKPRQANGARAEKFARRATKRAETTRFRAEAFERANGRCEGPQTYVTGELRRCLFPPTEWHHVFGRVRAKQAAENTAALCRGCHRAVGNPESAVFWWGWWSGPSSPLSPRWRAEAAALLFKHAVKATFAASPPSPASQERP